MLHDKAVSPAELKELAPYVSEHDLNDLSIAKASERTALKQDMLAQLLDRHGTGRLLFRNSRQSIQGFPKRVFLPQSFALPEQYKTVLRVMQSMQAQKDQKTQLAYALAPERMYQEFDGHGAGWWQFDPRIDWLLEFLLAN